MVAWDVKQVKSQQVFICCCTSACIHAYMLPVFFNTDQSHRAPRFAETQSMSQQAAAAIRPYGGLVLVGLQVDTSAPPAACIRRSNRAMQIIESTK